MVAILVPMCKHRVELEKLRTEYWRVRHERDEARRRFMKAVLGMLVCYLVSLACVSISSFRLGVIQGGRNVLGGVHLRSDGGRASHE